MRVVLADRASAYKRCAMAILEKLDQVPWGELFHQDHPATAATNVPVVLRALAERGPNHSFGSTGGTVATELTNLMRISPVTPHVVPFIVELIASDAELPTRRTCVRWLQSFFKYCTLGQITALFDVESHERDAAWVESLGLQSHLLGGAGLGLSDEGSPALLQALELMRERLGEHGGVFEMRRMFASVWRRDLWRAIASRIEVVLSTLDVGDEALSAEVIALMSWMPQKLPVIRPRLEAIIRAEGGGLLSSMALLAIARLRRPVNDVSAAIAVMGDALESKGERGLPAIYLASAEVLATKGMASPRSRRTLLKVDPKLARLPDPFSSTVAELVKLMSERLVWPKR